MSLGVPTSDFVTVLNSKGMVKMLTLEMFTAVQIMRPFWTKRLSCVSKQCQTRAVDDEEFNCISSSLLH